MTRLSTPTLLDFLREEASLLESSIPAADCESAGSGPETASIRVPLELDGCIWSAEVEEVQERHVHLIVDRDAVQQMDEKLEAAIHYQPCNSAMQRTAGMVTSGGFLSSNRVRLNFELS